MNYAHRNNSDENGLRRRIEDLDGIIEQIDEVLARELDVASSKRLISFIIPIKDERDTIQPLCHRIASHVPDGYDFEIVLVDDGSQDDSWAIIQRLARTYPARVRGIKFRHNAGKATALAAGFQVVQGELVFTIDADLQDDPQEIPRFLEKIDQGYDLVNGWKRVRHDPWHKVLPSRVFNIFASALGGVWLHDHNCGFKCYRAALVERLKLHGELHRMIPSMAGMHGFRCTEIEVKHHPRRTGQSKYGIERFLRGFCDVLTVAFLRRFRQRPSHFFGAAASAMLGIAAIMAMIGFWGDATSSRNVICWVVGSIFLATASFTFLAGLLAELVIRGPLNVHDELPVVCDTNIATRVDQPQRPAIKTPVDFNPLRAPQVSATQQTLFNTGGPRQQPAARQ